MYEVICLNLLTGQRFTKYIEGEYRLNQFEKKCKHSEKIKIVGWFKL